MTPFIKRNLLIPVSAILFAALIYCLIYVAPSLQEELPHPELLVISLLITLTLAVMLLWVTLGVFGGLAALLLALIFIYKPLTALNPYYYSVLIMAFFLNSFLAHHAYRDINRSNQEHTVTMERIAEDINLIRNHYDHRIAEIAAIEEKINSLFKLKNIFDELSVSLSTEEVVKIVTEKTFDKYKGGVRVLFYLADEDKSGLSLAGTMKAGARKSASMKKGGIFERWVVKNMQSLMVKDVRKDYRFSLEGEEKEEDFASIISKPLISEGNILGVLRVDSDTEDAFEQHDLRVLDIIGELAAVALENAELYKKTEELAIKDSLTGAYVHRYFMERLEGEVQRGLRSGNSFALFMMDIDDFKVFNDKYGHIAGDMILKKVSGILHEKASAGDIVCRYGGEEFAFLKLNCDRKRAIEIGGEIRKKVQSSPVEIRREKKSITISIGVAMFPEDAKVREDLIWESDRRLYKAKSEGKNTLCTE